MDNIKSIIESLIFVAGEPVSLDRLKKVLAPTATVEIRQTLLELIAEYEERAGGFTLKEVAGGFQFRTRPEFNKWIKLLIRPKTPRLSKPALETLAVIAYKQPVIRSDIEHIRGVDCGGVLRVLLERTLIRVLGRKEIPGRPLIYATTKHFLEVFDLKDLKDLPTPKEIEELEETAATEPIELGAEQMELHTEDGAVIPEPKPATETEPQIRTPETKNTTPSELTTEISTEQGTAPLESDYAAGQLKLSDAPDDVVTGKPAAPPAEMPEQDTRAPISSAGEGIGNDTSDRPQGATAPNHSDGQEEKQDRSQHAFQKDLEEIDEGNRKNT